MPVKVICDGCGATAPQHIIKMITLRNIREEGDVNDFIIIDNTKDTEWMTNLHIHTREILIACSQKCADRITRKIYFDGRTN